MSYWKSHIKNLTMETPEDLLANPANARRHPAPQRDALEGSLDELGWVGAIVVNDRTGHVCDGHARVEAAISRGEAVVPVLHIDISEADERLMLAVFDPITNMAKLDQERLDDLLASIETENPALLDLLGSLSAEDVDGAPIHPPAAPKEARTIVLIFDDRDDLTEFAGYLSLLPGGSPADKLLRLVREHG